MSNLPALMNDATDPARLGWPVPLPYELALGESSVREICESYGISKAEWDVIRAHPGFQKQLEVAVEQLKIDGMSFKIKARLQSEELLKTSWRIIHDDDTPANVKADLLKFTIKAAGLDASKEQMAGAGRNTNAMQININLG